MNTIAVTFYNVVVWLHVSSVVIAFGPTFAFGLYIALAQRKYPRAIPAVLETQMTITRSMVTLGGALILITGLYLTSKQGWEFSDFFVVWGLLAIIGLLGLAHGFFLPNDQRALRAAKRDIEAAGPTGEVELGREYHEYSGRSARMGPIAGLIVILTIYVMAAKPFL
jgi:MFS family permease